MQCIELNLARMPIWTFSSAAASQLVCPPILLSHIPPQSLSVLHTRLLAWYIALPHQEPISLHLTTDLRWNAASFWLGFLLTGSVHAGACSCGVWRQRGLFHAGSVRAVPHRPEPKLWASVFDTNSTSCCLQAPLISGRQCVEGSRDSKVYSLYDTDLFDRIIQVLVVMSARGN